MPAKILFSWSGGKDSALALHALLQDQGVQVVALITTVTADYDRISMHGIRRELLEKQAESIGISLEQVIISKSATNDEYENKMKTMLLKYKGQGVSAVGFGDIFLEDLRKYRESNLAKIGMKGLFPLWKQDSHALAARFIDLKFKASISCVDSKVLDKRFCGRDYDRALLSELPDNVDCCGENGEFHSFVYAGPIFKKEIPFEKGEVVLRDNRFYFCDFVPQLSNDEQQA